MNTTTPPMKQIKFSHHYTKLGAQPPHIATLLEVIDVQLEDLSIPFLAYDTNYIGGKYPLPLKGKYLLLLFLAKGMLFSTLRRSTPTKRKYYINSIGEQFKVVIK